MSRAVGQKTFRILDGDVATPTPVMALEMWYAEVRDIKIADMSVEHLARACRQDLFFEEVVPFCLRKLEEEPLAGELYDGELVLALRRGHGDYWRIHGTERAQFLALAKRAYEASGDAELNFAKEDLLRK